MNRLMPKNTTASHLVLLDRKLDAPRAPNTVPEAPAPKPEPAAAPAPRWSRIGNLLGPRRPTLEKLSPYECGFEAFEDARMKFDVRYYLIAIQFIVFDLEIIFIVPWTLVFQELGPRALVTMGLFVGMLFLGFIYVWKKGALEWE